VLPKSAQVFGVHTTHASFVQTCPAGHGWHDFVTPQPRLTAAHPFTSPASWASAHVDGVQHVCSEQTSVPAQLPQLTAGPHPFCTLPHLALPHVGGVHGLHTCPTHSVAPLHEPQVTLPLPQAFGIEPQNEPPSLSVHSGGVLPQMPPWQLWPLGQLQLLVWPHPLVTVPHRFVCGSGVHVGAGHASPWPASLGPPSTHALSTQS
jgi:hypothetical protein